jgi:hypothetical protein
VPAQLAIKLNTTQIVKNLMKIFITSSLLVVRLKMSVKD